VGFVTARLHACAECDEAERELVRAELRWCAPCSPRRQQMLYVLTLGVLPPFREAGLGSDLVRRVSP
jgi:hypothetical protein